MIEEVNLYISFIYGRWMGKVIPRESWYVDQLIIRKKLTLNIHPKSFLVGWIMTTKITLNVTTESRYFLNTLCVQFV